MCDLDWADNKLMTVWGRGRPNSWVPQSKQHLLAVQPGEFGLPWI